MKCEVIFITEKRITKYNEVNHERKLYEKKKTLNKHFLKITFFSYLHQVLLKLIYQDM